MDKEWLFVLKKFSEYYKNAEFNIPEIEKREFGIGIKKKIDVRHLGFENENELKTFLVNTPPLYLSHSVGYYELPKATPMERKTWLSADLVFDLDIESKNIYFSKTEFDKIKEDTLRLIEEFLIADFGIQKKNLAVNFSGNRGFHIHVREPSFGKLKTEERKEIIGYVKGLGLKYRAFFSQKESGIDNIGRVIYQESGPNENSGGYGGKFIKKVLRVLETNPERISRIFKNRAKREIFINEIKKGNWSLRKMSSGIDKKLQEIAEKELPLHTVNVDSGVTQDISKLIRVPNSIHGGCALCAKILEYSKLSEFEPLKDSIIFSKNPVKIQAIHTIPEIEIGGIREEKIEKGKIKEIPEYFALYLKLKESAKILL